METQIVLKVRDRFNKIPPKAVFKSLNVPIERQIGDKHLRSPVWVVLLIGKFESRNIVEVMMDGFKTKGIIGTGSIVTTIIVTTCITSDPNPELLSFTDLSLHVSVASGEIISYLGYKEVGIWTEFLSWVDLDVPDLVVSNTENRSEAPICIGTNFTDELMKERCIEESNIPEE